MRWGGERDPHTEEMLHGKMEPGRDVGKGQQERQEGTFICWERTQSCRQPALGRAPALGVALFLVCTPWLRAHVAWFCTQKRS